MTMRRVLEPIVRRAWTGGEGVPERLFRLLALPPSFLFWTGVRIRNALYDREVLAVRRSDVPVVSVGNLVVGGTGKTPISAWIVTELLGAGRHPALIARGYGEDELELHRRWNPQSSVIADPDRVRGVARAVREGADCVVLDDGFQHRRLARDLDIVLVAAEHPFPPRMLPRGPAREPVSALSRADLVVVTRRTASAATAESVAAALRARVRRPRVSTVDLAPGGWMDLDLEAAPGPESEVLAVTAVADPMTFRDTVGHVLGGAPEMLAFPDHHDFDAADCDRIVRAAGPRALVTTEKDAVKLAAFRNALPEVRVLPLTVDPTSAREALAPMIEQLLKNTPTHR